MSHPTWVRGLKHVVGYRHPKHFGSHPTWVRGLKHHVNLVLIFIGVAPYVGAWIETKSVLTTSAP